MKPLINTDNLVICVLTFFLFTASNSFSNEIVQDKNGNYYLMKEDGSFKKLPPPKPGYKYTIKEKKEEKKVSKNRKKQTRSAKKIITRSY